MSRCYYCDESIAGPGLRRWVPVRVSSWSSASWRSFRVGSGESRGLRTLCIMCAYRVDGVVRRQVPMFAWPPELSDRPPRPVPRAVWIVLAVFIAAVVVVSGGF
jgi:hypothetical protein